MSKFYITYDERKQKRSFYSYQTSTNNIFYIPLKEQEISVLLQDIDNNNIINIIEKNANAIEIIFKNERKIVIDDIRIFEKSGNYKVDTIINKLQRRIVNYIEQKNIRDYQKNLPRGYKPKVNRNRNKNRGKKLIVGGLSAVMIICLAANLANEIKKIEKTELDDTIQQNYYSEQKIDNQKDIYANITTIQTQVKDVLEQQYPDIQIESIEIEPEISKTASVSLELEDRTQTGKLQKTVDFCGEIIEYYSNRYGLPYREMCAQISQESPMIINGSCENVCQITYEMFIGKKMHVPVYDKNGFTGSYDNFTVTKEMLDTTEGNIMVGMAYNRYCIDKYQSLFTGLFSYNQGENALNNACNFYGLDVNNYLGDENSISARDLINKYYREGLNKKHGDSKYLENVFSYLPMDDRGTNTIKYYLGNELITVDLTNTNVYNSELSR